MRKSSRLSAEERRLSILIAAIPLFAKNGFNGTTTKQIARAAQVSEALLYRHFPSKESLYHALKELCCRKKEDRMALGLTPSTVTLVRIVHYLISAIAMGVGHDEGEGLTHEDMHRLMANSYLEDGNFARMFLDENIKIWLPFLEECIEAAIASGDMLADWIQPRCRWWFAHHIGAALGLLNLPVEPVIRYGVAREKLLDQAVRFSLRGMGLTDHAIQAYYNLEELNAFTNKLAKGHQA